MRAHRTKIGIEATLLLACLAITVQAASPESNARTKNTDREVVDLLAAVDNGQIDVRFIPKDETRATLLITNKGLKPLSIRLPDAFAGVPVLAQFNDFFGQGRGQGNPFAGGGRDGGNTGQGLGVNNQNNGVFSVPPEKVRKIKVDAVCLDHGKPNPNPRMEYQIVPVESYVSKPEVVELLKMMGRGKASRLAVQAAAWHLNNGKSWKFLAAMRSGPKRLNGSRAPYFSRETLKKAANLAMSASQKAKSTSSLAGR